VIVAAGALLAPAAIAHPDLTAQIERLGEQIQAEPENAEWLIRRGDLRRRHEEYAAAGRDFEAARMLAPDHPEIDFYQGQLELETGNFDAAARFLSRYLAANPEHPGAWRLRAESAAGQGENRTAADAFERAVRYSRAPSPALCRQWVLALLAAGDRPGALAAVDAGLERVGVEVSLLGLGADTALAERDARRAQSYLERVPAGLEGRQPWSDRMVEAECLAHREEAAGDAGAGCAAHASARLDAQLGAVSGPD
jgi:tetratricopeptide (TPR) repeat protein